MKRLLIAKGLSRVMVIVALSFSACALEGAQVIGPAGGCVFYDKGSYSNGWRYLELSPEDAGEAVWKGETTIDGLETEEGMGAGFENTRRILVYLGAEAKAAQICDQFSYGGFDDWFLPSVTELKKAFEAYQGEMSGSYYWTSSVYNTSWTDQVHSVYSDSTGDIRSSSDYPSSSLHLRPVRRF